MTRDDLIREIEECLGDHATRDDATLVFNYLSRSGIIEWDNGFRLPAEVDLLLAYEEATSLLHLPGCSYLHDGFLQHCDCREV